MNKKDEIKILIDDIKDLSEKLLCVATKKVNLTDKIALMKQERTIRNRLKDKIETYNKIKEAISIIQNEIKT